MKDFTTPKTDKLPEITWDELGAHLGSDYELDLSVQILYGIGTDNKNYIGTGHFISGELKDVYEIEERVFLFKKQEVYYDDVRTNNSIVEERTRNAGFSRITGKLNKK